MTDFKRYENPPLSEKTVKGMSLNIDDLAAIGRLLSLQDNVYDEQFEKILDLLKDQAIEIKELRKEVNELKDQVAALKDQIAEITQTVDVTKDEVEEIKKDVARLKKSDAVWSHAIRIGIGILVGIGLIRMFHGPF